MLRKESSSVFKPANLVHTTWILARVSDFNFDALNDSLLSFTIPRNKIVTLHITAILSSPGSQDLAQLRRWLVAARRSETLHPAGRVFDHLNRFYSADIDWTSWTSWNEDSAYAIDRAYDSVHVAAAYWSLYRVARAYPSLVKVHDWEWYLNQAYRTVIRGMQTDVGYNRLGLMGETLLGREAVDEYWEQLRDYPAGARAWRDEMFALLLSTRPAAIS